ncbi:MAG TPA: chromosome partitioning protein ParB [Lachnospiraceae bacterium]|nr:chromosome partitioning protein ParB [Lachnospiraceae bacterium]
MAGKRRRALGAGLDALIPQQDQETEKEEQTGERAQRKSVSRETSAPTVLSDGSVLKMVRTTSCEPDRSQPRKTFSEESINELAESIRQKGLLEPLIVVQNRDNDRYTIVAGERRWRACTIAGVKEIPVVVRTFESERDQMECSLIENIIREDLNPIEEAQAYQKLINEFSLTQEEVAKTVQKNRTTITNSLRLLKLSEDVQNYVIEGKLDMGHARALLAVEDPKEQKRLADLIIEKNLSVREVERLIASLGKTKKKKPGLDREVAAGYRDCESRMNESLGMKVQVKPKADGKSGRIEITFTSQDEFEKVLERLLEE